MQKIIRKYFLLIMVVATITILLFHYVMVGITLSNEKERSFQNKLDQMISVVKNNDIELETLTESLNEDYLTRARAFAYLIEKDSRILENTDELQKISELLNVDELHVSDEYGTIQYSSVSKYVGLNFHDGQQMQEFLPLLDDDLAVEYIVQEVQPNTAENKMMQYVGVRRHHEKGIVEVGLKPERLLEAKRRNTYSYIFDNIPVDEGESLFAVDMTTQEVLAHTNSRYEGENLQDDLKISISDFQKASSGQFFVIDNAKRYILTKECEGVLFGAGIPETILYKTRLRETLTFAFYMMIIYIISLIVVNKVMNRYIISGVYKIIAELQDIQNGHLDKTVEVNTAPEFMVLSQGINEMVDGILNATVKVSQIIEMADVPIAAFECRHDVERVLVTERLKDILHLEDDEANEIFAHKDMFLNKLEIILKNGLENNIYCVDHQYYVRIHMVYENDDVLGTIEDITKDYQRHCLLKYESEHDALTQLVTYKVFKEKVGQLLKQSDVLKTAAVIMIDLDDFKQINDSYGHDFGDLYLKKIAHCLKTLTPQNVVVSRRSGDEFCIFLYGFDSKNDIAARVRDLWDQIAQAKLYPTEYQEIHLSISGGLTWNYGNGFEEMMRNADEILYKAKNNTKGKCYIESYF